MKKAFLFSIPLSVCNFRCEYCYLTHRQSQYEGVIPEMRFTPEEVAYAMRKERVGGPAYINFCADGETLLLPGIADYINLLAKEGHYIEVVSNMVLTKKLDPILALGPDVLSHVEFKCSFHYLELQKRGLLEVFADNVRRAREAGASVNVEITPSDELIEYLDEVKRFSLENFGALPHISIARADNTAGIDRLTDLPLDEYNEIWSTFDSDFWKYKTSIFGVRQKDFCYAGSWLYYVDMSTGEAYQCYAGGSVGNIFANPDDPLPERPIGSCPLPHCYNGHMLITLGTIPGATDVGYGDIRDRLCVDGSRWLKQPLKTFFNEKLAEDNDELSLLRKTAIRAGNGLRRCAARIRRS